MKLESMSKNIVKIMGELIKNDGLNMLLVNNVSNPFDPTLPEINPKKLIVPNNPFSKIYPYPFDPDATTTDASFIRVYYNDGAFNANEVIAEAQLHIDVIVAKSLWLIDDGTDALIRPYEIAGRVITMLGATSVGSKIKLKFDGYQHLYVNPKFDAIRLYANYMSVETGKN